MDAGNRQHPCGDHGPGREDPRHHDPQASGEGEEQEPPAAPIGACATTWPADRRQRRGVERPFLENSEAVSTPRCTKVRHASCRPIGEPAAIVLPALEDYCESGFSGVAAGGLTAGVAGAAAAPPDGSASPFIDARICSSRRVPGHLHAGLLDLHHPALDRVLRQLRGAERVGVAPLDLVPDLVEASGCSPVPRVSLIDCSDALTCSCIFACSSWLSSLVRSASFCCSTIAFCSTAFLAWPAACRAWSCSVLRSSTLCSAVTSWVGECLGGSARTRWPSPRRPRRGLVGQRQRLARR